VRHKDRGLFTRQPVVKDPEGKVKIEDNPHLMEKALKGRRALKSVDENFAKSRIAHLKITEGPMEVIDQYYTVEKNGKPVASGHVYSPEGKKAVPEVGKGEELYEWRDGKKVKVKSQDPPPSVITIELRNQRAFSGWRRVFGGSRFRWMR